MKRTDFYILFILLFLSSCNQSRKEKAISSLNEYNKGLKNISIDSSSRLDTAIINSNFQKLNESSIDQTLIEEIKDESVFKEALESEKQILNNWKSIDNFKSYFDQRPDTLLNLIRRCSAFDRAPSSVERAPSIRGMRTFSMDYYKIEVPVAFHIIVNQNGEGQEGNMTERIQNQIDLLNSIYGKFRVSFKLVSTDVTINNNWFENASYYSDQDALRQMTSTLSKNPSKFMNVFSVGSNQVLGEATYPWYPEKGTNMDYIVINHNTLPGGTSNFLEGKYNQGKTLVHEAGHFLGLFHTFEGGNVKCDSDYNDGCSIGDQVDDTPYQRICYFVGCDKNADSCPLPGSDPVQNFMGYNPDECMNEFTNGQGDRLLQSIIKFRFYLVTNP